MPDPLQLLLDVQGRDLAAAQLNHRRATLPERQAVAARRVALAELDASHEQVRARLHEARRDQKRLEDEVAGIEAKHAAETARLYAGTITSPRELQALQEEIDGLARRQRDVEDQVLSAMEVTEPLDAEVADLEARRAGLLDELSTLETELAEAERRVDDELATVLGERAAAAAQVPADLLATYETLRDRLGGIGVARLEGAQCLGCHLSLPATELDAVRHAAPGAVVLHEECGRILVH